MPCLRNAVEAFAFLVGLLAELRTTTLLAIYKPGLAEHCLRTMRLAPRNECQTRFGRRGAASLQLFIEVVRCARFDEGATSS